MKRLDIIQALFDRAAALRIGADVDPSPSWNTDNLKEVLFYITYLEDRSKIIDDLRLWMDLKREEPDIEVLNRIRDLRNQ